MYEALNKAYKLVEQHMLRLEILYIVLFLATLLDKPLQIIVLRWSFVDFRLHQQQRAKKVLEV